MRRIYPFIYRISRRLIHILESFLTKVQGKTLVALSHEDQATLIGYLVETLPGLAGPHMQYAEIYQRLFRALQERGVHVTPNYYYSPVPDTHALERLDIWEKESEMPGINMNADVQIELLRKAFPLFQEEYNQIPHQPSAHLPAYAFHFNNGVFDGIDALVLYSMLRHFKPKRMIEVGSGWSTRLAAQAALKNGNTRLISIEPYPNDMLRAGFPGLESCLPKKVEEVDLDFFLQLSDGDFLFIDTSHVVKTGGDVCYLYLEVLPRLKKGVIIHVHDIFFPREYPKYWITDKLLFWNEQYLLQAFLAFNSHFQILFANQYMYLKHFQDLQAAFPKAPFHHTGQSLWMQKVL